MKKRENGYAGRDTGELDSANRPCVCVRVIGVMFVTRGELSLVSSKNNIGVGLPWPEKWQRERRKR